MDGFFVKLGNWLAGNREVRLTWYAILFFVLVMNGYISLNLTLILGGLALIVEGFTLLTAGIATRK